MSCGHADPQCGCSFRSWTWYDASKGLVFLENPKAASTFIKEGLMSDAEELFGEIPKDARVFGIYRDPVDKMVSVFKDFTKSDKTHRLERMSKIFSLTVSEVSDLSFDQFLILSLRFRDHHWDPNSRFLKVDHPNVSLFYYHPEVMGDVERFLGVSLDAKTVNASESLEVSVSPRSATLIRRLFQEDYRNQDYFAGRIVNARSGMSLGTGEDLR